ncbi:DUF4160 domain-containing protein [soil metagenome]
MPTVLRVGPYRFLFYASDGGEPRHVHVARDGADAKFWLDPDVSLARNRGYAARELKTIEKLLASHLQALRDAWDVFFAPPAANH